MKIRRIVVPAFVLLLIVLAHTAPAQEIWSGNDFMFTKPPGADPRLEENQDRITPETWIAREGSGGLFNIKTELSYANFESPENTEWAYDLPGNGNSGQPIVASNYANLTFEDWKSAINGPGDPDGGPVEAIGLPAVVHLIFEDIYFDITVLSWSQSGKGGGFSYTRAAPEPTRWMLNLTSLVALAMLARRRSVSR